MQCQPTASPAPDANPSNASGSPSFSVEYLPPQQTHPADRFARSTAAVEQEAAFALVAARHQLTRAPTVVADYAGVFDAPVGP